MADDIVQTVKLEGVDETVSGFEKVEKAGTDAMGGIGRAVPTANKAAGDFASKISQIEQASRKFGSSLRDFGSASQRFASNVGRMGATVTKYAAAAGLGFAAIKKLSGAQEDHSADTKEALALNKLEARSMSQAQIAALNYAKSLRELDRSSIEGAQDRSRKQQQALEDLDDAFRKGTISAEQKAEAVAKIEKDAERERSDAMHKEMRERQNLARQHQEEQDLAKQTALIKSAEAEETIRNADKIKTEAASRKAYAEAVKSYGADTAQAMTQLGPAYDAFLKKLNEGPSVIADIMRGITTLFNTHGTEIVKIVNEIGDAFASLFAGDSATDRVQSFSDTMMGAIRGVGSAIKDYLIPALKTIVGWFDVIAKGLNAVFGTKLTGGVLAMGAAFLVFSGALPAIAAGVTAVVFAFKALNLALGALTSLTPMGVAIRLIIVALVLLYAHWDKIGPLVKKVVDYVKQTWQEWSDWFGKLINAINQKWIDFKTALQEAFDAAKEYVMGWITWVGDQINEGIEKIKGYWNAFTTWLGEFWEGAKQLGSDVWDTVVQYASDTVDKIKGYWNSFIEFFPWLWGEVKRLAQEGWDGFLKIVQDVIKTVKDYLIGLVPGLRQVLSYLGKINTEAAAAPAEPGRARGGPIYGPGTATSDSVRIRASRGEWVIQAKAVQHYGRRFMAMVNSMRLPRGGMPSLADSLVLPSPMARFATGGEVGGRTGSRVLNLTLPGLGSFPGLTGPDDTMDRLQVAAVRSQIRSAGRLPGWYGGR